MNEERIAQLEKALEAALKKIAELENLLVDKDRDLESWKDSHQYEE